jgi:hypothetical protein
VSDPDTPRLDWDGIFDRAHRRLLIRLALLAAAGALGALLLLGGGLSARGTVRWRIGPIGNVKKVLKPKVNVDPEVVTAWHRQRSPAIENPPPPEKPGSKPEAIAGPVPPPPVPIEDEEKEDSPACEDEQYSDCLPESPENTSQSTTNSASTESPVSSTKGPANGSTEYTEGSVPTVGQGDLANATPESGTTE